MRPIDADELMEILTTTIRIMQGVAKFLGVENDPEMLMEIKAYTDIATGVKDMPTIEPEREKGEWIDKSGGIEGAWNYCSMCGERAIDLYDFCPNCGADMRG